MIAQIKKKYIKKNCKWSICNNFFKAKAEIYRSRMSASLAKD